MLDNKFSHVRMAGAYVYGERAPRWPRFSWDNAERSRYTTQFNSSHFTRLEINPCSTGIESKTTPRKRENRGERVDETAREETLHRYNPARVCTCFTSTPRLFADSKLCRTMRVPLSAFSPADYKTGKREKACALLFYR